MSGTKKQKLGAKAGPAAMLDKILSGWTILSVESSQKPESIFRLNIEKEGKRKTITVFATDLGWWFRDV